MVDGRWSKEGCNIPGQGSLSLRVTTYSSGLNCRLLLPKAARLRGLLAPYSQALGGAPCPMDGPCPAQWWWGQGVCPRLCLAPVNLRSGQQRQRTRGETTLPRALWSAFFRSIPPHCCTCDPNLLDIPLYRYTVIYSFSYLLWRFSIFVIINHIMVNVLRCNPVLIIS